MTRELTVKEFRDQLIGLPDNDLITFSGLDFYRIKKRDTNLFDIEFSQSVYKDKNGTWHISDHT